MSPYESLSHTPEKYLIMHWNDLRGHNQQHESFKRAVTRDRLSHAYLFVGPAGIGKQAFARLLSQSLFCDQHPDKDLEFWGNALTVINSLAEHT
ncbi:MAG: hypothetical protein R3C11_26060 [Planctomycetaceae bacterium]